LPQTLAFVEEAYVPATQSMQTVPEPLPYVPIGHCVQVEDPKAEVKVPIEQAMHAV
jgi:hypothetical protein